MKRTSPPSVLAVLLLVGACQPMESSPPVQLSDAAFATAVTLTPRHRRVNEPMSAGSSVDGYGTILGGTLSRTDLNQKPLVTVAAGDCGPNRVAPGESFELCAEYVGGPIDLVRVGFGSGRITRHFEVPVSSELRGGVLRIAGKFNPAVIPNKNSSHSAVLQVRRVGATTWSDSRSVRTITVGVEPPMPVMETDTGTGGTGGGSGGSGGTGGGTTGALARCVDVNGVCIELTSPSSAVSAFRTQCTRDRGTFASQGCASCSTSGPICRNAMLTATGQRYTGTICYGASFCRNFPYIDTKGACEQDQGGTAAGRHCTQP